jgi:glycosyltransferase involved in cell wall biosynthesis
LQTDASDDIRELPPGRSPPLRVALACPGVGLVQRGFERMFADLFEVLRERTDLDVTLFKGGGPRDANQRVPLFLPRNGALVRALPVHKLFGRSPIHVECLTYGLGLLPHLRAGAFDVVHCIDPPLARMLYKLRRALGMDFRLLYTEGCAMPPADYPPADYLQHVALGAHEEALQAGIAPRSMALVPCGIHPGRFEVAESRAALRARHGVAEGEFVILSVGALNRGHKRLHHIIEEVAGQREGCLLWLDGSADQGDPDLADFARARLGGRVRVSHVPSAQVGELYRMADVLVHAATAESFGLAIVEAAATGLPVLIHDAPHFRWLVPVPGSWVDMTKPGALSARLSELRADPGRLEALRCGEAIRRRFDWRRLGEDYAQVYHHVARLPAPVAAAPRVNFFHQLHG